MPSHRVDDPRPMRVAAALALLVFGACRHGEQPDAYGNFEATETVVSAQTSGALLWFAPM